MGQAAYKIIDRRGKSLSSSDRLINASRPTIDRRRIPGLGYDAHRNVTHIGRQNLLSLGRSLFSNFDIVRGAVCEMADNAISTWLPQYYGATKDWGKLAEEWMLEHDKICETSGSSMDVFLRNLIIGVLRDGDIGTILTETEDGYPMIQAIPGHRIGCASGEELVEGGPFDGAKIFDGVIVNDYGRPIAYRILSESGGAKAAYEDVSARNMILSFIPDYVGQVRGYSLIGSGAFRWQDVDETRGFEMLSQKLGAALGFIERNETGEADAAKAVLSIPGTVEGSTGATGVTTERVDGVTIRYFKAGTGSGLEAVKNDRPSMNQQAFEDKIVRCALNGIGWSADFSLDPKKSGAAMRIIVSNINARLAVLQKFIIKPARTRIDGYRISKAVELGLLPHDIEWYKFRYQGPRRITSDAAYDSQIAINEIRAGIKTPQEACEERGTYWEDVQDDKIAWEKRLQERCAEEGVSVDRVELLTPNGNPVSNDNNQAKTEEEV